LVLDDSPASFPIAVGTGTVTSTFTWPTICNQVQLQPYQMVFIARDTFTNPQLTDIKTINIKVIGPPPQNLSASAVGNSIHLSWGKLDCEKVIGYEIYRRNGYFGFNPGPCEPGVPEYTGYIAIAVNEGKLDTTFIDNNNGSGLIHGVDYCYMVVANFPDGAQSYASEEVCAALKKDVPIITNTSVQKTDIQDGYTFVAWAKPTEMDTLLFPSPYKYIINRSLDNDPGGFIVIDSTMSLNDTTYFDYGLNTTNHSYIYKIDLYCNQAEIPYWVGSTHIAQTMFLNVTPSDESLILSWLVNVPWNNNFYTIFRLNDESNIFDSIGYSGEPSYKDSNLVNYHQYTYYIESVGKYSAQGLVDPIINFSQIASGIPEDNVPPCPPALTVKTNCDRIENVLSWDNAHGCPADVAMYYISFSPRADQELVVIDSVPEVNEKIYVHKNLNSIVGCYGVFAIDSVGNIGELSNVVCVNIDSCSLYSLPNVFTPNGDEYNEIFIPFDYTSVDKIQMKIFNRWGRLVFETEDPDINWDGKNKNNNSDCSAGAYFYVCDVYEIHLTGITKRTLTGSITIIR